MKIALIHFRMLHVGGLETRLFSYIDHLTARGHEVTVIVSKLGKDIEVPATIRFVQLKHCKFPKVLSQLFFDRALRRFMAKENFDFSLSLGRTSTQDAVLAPGNHPGYLAALGRRPFGISDFVQTHLDKLAYRNSKLILASSEMMRSEVIRYFDEAPEKVHVLHPPVNTDRFRPALKGRKAEFRAKHGFSEGKTSFLFLSTGHKRKGLPLLLRVFKALENEPLELIVAGSKIRNRLPANVKSLGFVKSTEELYAAADFTIHPSVYEPYGQIVAESIVCGTPVLISDRVGAKEIVSANNGVVISLQSESEWIREVRGMKDRSFSIEEAFAEKMGLTVQQHLDRMLHFVTGD